METRGTLRDVTRTLDGKHMIVSFQCEAASTETIEAILGKDLDITTKVHREKRSINANSYFHVLASKIAAATGRTATHEKNRLIREYGFWQVVDGAIPTLTMKAEYEDRVLDMDGLHVKVVSRDGDTIRFGLMRGSHTYDTKEMSRLIDGAVQDAKDLGIETLTPADLERMKAAWRKDRG